MNPNLQRGIAATPPAAKYGAKSCSAKPSTTPVSNFQIKRQEILAVRFEKIKPSAAGVFSTG
jgi:hypothetical protein